MTLIYVCLRCETRIRVSLVGEMWCARCRTEMVETGERVEVGGTR